MEFRILGHLEVVDGNGTIPLPGAKTKALLAMMLGRANWVISTEELVEGLWGDRPPATAANTLQTYVSQLRKALGAATIQTRGPGYVLVVEPQHIDAVRFEGLLRDARSRLTTDPDHAVSLLREALALWRGPALADFTFEAFAAPEIARLEELRLVATEERIEAELALGRHDQLTAGLRRLVEEHPVRERLWTQLMVALYRSGRQAEALRAFAELRRIMRDELGVEPSSSVRRLEEAMVLQDPQLEWAPAERDEPAPPVLSNLPVARSPFVGRESELRELVKTVERHGLVTVVGPPGVGKSRLALEAARQVFDEYPDGVWLAQLFALNDQSRVPNVVAAAVGAGRDDVASSTAELSHRLQAQRALIVLDGCEHLLPSSAALADEMLRACPPRRARDQPRAVVHRGRDRPATGAYANSRPPRPAGPRTARVRLGTALRRVVRQHGGHQRSRRRRARCSGPGLADSSMATAGKHGQDIPRPRLHRRGGRERRHRCVPARVESPQLRVQRVPEAVANEHKSEDAE